jgi:hypothetical protein
MKKLLRVCVAVGLALGLFLLIGCGDDKGAGVGPNVVTPNSSSNALNGEWKLLKEASSGQSLVGTVWRLSAIVDVAGDAVAPAPAQVSNSDKSYTLEFKEDGTLTTYSLKNQFHGTYTVESRGNDDVYKISIADFYGPEINEDRSLWRDVLPNVTSFAVQENDPATYGRSLKLFYNENASARYLLFRVWGDIGIESDPVGSTCLDGVGLSKKNCGDGGGPFGQRSGDGDTVTVVSGR